MAFQPQPAFEELNNSKTLNQVNDAVILAFSGAIGATANISGTWVGTILFEGTNDNFATVQTISVTNHSTGALLTSVTTNGYYNLITAAFTRIRARVSAYTSGSATVTLTASITSAVTSVISVNHDSVLTKSKIVGSDGSTVADVELISGKKRLLTDSIVTVEEIFGQDPFPDSYFKITQAGAVDDTVRVQVAATSADPSSPDSDVAAVDLTYTLVSADAGNEMQLRDNIVSYLNAQSSFTDAFLKAQKVKDIPIVHITSTKRSMGDDFYERPNAGDFNITATGSTTVSMGFTNFISRGKSTSLARDPDSPHRLGILGISGSVNVTPGAISELYLEQPELSGSADMRVDGSSAVKVFTIPLDSTKSIYVEEVRAFGGGNGVKFEQFLSKSSTTLTNGVKIEIKSNDQSITLPLIKTTEDFKNKFCFGGGGPGSTFRLDIQAGADQFTASFIPHTPFVLKKTGTFTTDDYLKITIQDNLTAGLAEFEFIVKGFLREE